MQRMILDNIECLSVQNQVTNFPKHFHETFCISLIHQGIEQINLESQCLYSEEGSISITNPYEIHSNPLIDSTSPLEFDTLYISKDLMKYLFDGKNISFLDRKIKEHKANHLFGRLKNAIELNHMEAMEHLLMEFAAVLKQHAQEKTGEYLELNFHSLNNINDFIDHNIKQKFSLDELCKIANLNKYGFAKRFKASTGMSPMNYILMKKIFSSKRQISPNSELTQIAFDYEFTDMAHFSNTFKRFIGISPKAYQKSISSDL